MIYLEVDSHPVKNGNGLIVWLITNSRSTFFCLFAHCSVFSRPNVSVAESERFPEENRASLHVTREHLDQLVQCIVGNVKSKLGQGFIDNLLLTQMQLLASLIRHCDTVSRTDAGRRRDRKTRTNVSVFTSAARQELCSDICPRLLNLINRALGARIKDVEVRLAEAEMLNTGTGHSVNGDFQASE